MSITHWLNDRTGLFLQKVDTDEWIPIDRVFAFDVFWGGDDIRVKERPATVRFTASLPDGQPAFEIGMWDTLCLVRSPCGPTGIWGDHIKPFLIISSCSDIQKRMLNMVALPEDAALLSITVELTGYARVFMAEEDYRST